MPRFRLRAQPPSQTGPAESAAGAAEVNGGPGLEYVLELAAGGTVGLSPASSTALVGADALRLLDQLIGRPGVALLLADSASPLHPGYSVGRQISDALPGTRRAALDRATDLLETTGVPEPHERVGARPHELTALDRQRAQLALVLTSRPQLVLGYDPSAGLSNADAAAFGSAVSRLKLKFGYTLAVAAPEQRTVVRLVNEILILGEGRVLERRRRATAP
jgi:ABC-type dipeptide/oligopeptide/nickel transport system ATPase component